MKLHILAVALLALGATSVAAQPPLTGQVGTGIPRPDKPFDKKQTVSLCPKEHWPKCENHKQYDCWKYFNVQKSTCRTTCTPTGAC